MVATNTAPAIAASHRFVMLMGPASALDVNLRLALSRRIVQRAGGHTAVAGRCPALISSSASERPSAMLLTIKALAYLEILLIAGLLLFRWALKNKLRANVGAKAIGLTLGMPVVMFFATTPYILEAFLALIIPLVSRSRLQVCVTYVLLLPMAPVFAQDTSIGGINLFQFSTDMALACGGLLGLAINPRENSVRQPAIDASVLALAMVFVFSQAQGGSETVFLKMCLRNVFEIGGPYLIASRSISSSDDAEKVFISFYVSAFLAAFVACFEILRHWSLYQEAASHIGSVSKTIGYLNVRGGIMRAEGPFLSSSGLGFFLAVAAVGLGSIKTVFRTFGFMLISTVIIAGLILAQSRGAWLASITGYIFYCFYRKKYRIASIMLTGAAVLSTLGFILPRHGKLAELLGIAGSGADTSEYRKLLLQSGLRQVGAHPLFGQPRDVLVEKLSNLIQGEGIVDPVNGHLYIAMTAGLVGLSIWIAVLTFAVVKAWRCRNTPSNRARSPAWIAIPTAIIVASAVGLIFTSTANRTMIWPVLALGLTAALVTAARRSP